MKWGLLDWALETKSLTNSIASSCSTVQLKPKALTFITCLWRKSTPNSCQSSRFIGTSSCAYFKLVQLSVIFPLSPNTAEEQLQDVSLTARLPSWADLITTGPSVKSKSSSWWSRLSSFASFASSKTWDQARSTRFSKLWKERPLSTVK